jgi:PAS domain S-box-containing protein
MVPSDAAVITLLEELLRVHDVEEACSLAVERLGAATGFDHAVLLLLGVAGVRGAARHLSYGEMSAVLVALNEPGSGFGDLLRSIDRPTPVANSELPALRIASPLGIPIRDGSDIVVGMLVVDADISDARCHALHRALVRIGPALGLRREVDVLDHAVRRLSGQRDLLRHLINTLSDPVLLTDQSNDIVFANHRAERLFVPTPADSEGRSRALQINNLLFSSFLTQSIIGPASVGRELNLVDTEEGSDLLFEVISLRYGGSVDGLIISVLRDITDLKRAVTELEVQFRRSRAAEHETRQERDRLNVILENVGDPILVTDEHSNIILTNPGAERLFLMGEDDAAKPMIRQLIQANDTRFTTLISDFLLRDELHTRQRIMIKDTDTGRPFPAEVVSSKIMNTRGEPVAIVSVLHDLTHAEENERLASELQQLNEQLEERVRRATRELEERNAQLQWQSVELKKASQLKTEFLASMSHELRTPINVILGYTSLLREGIYGELIEAQEDALGRIHSTSQHLLELINNILDLSKIEAGMMPVNAEAVDVHELVAQLSATISPIIAKKGLVYEVNVAEDLPLLVTDRVKLKQVLLNVLSNAIKFTPAGRIRLAVCRRCDTPGVHIEVTDTGIGIREEHLRDIFEAFRQIDQSHTREFAGTGLGLSITKKLLDLMQGTIDVRSHFGEGSSFSIDLPQLDEAERQVATTTALNPRPR